MCSSVCAGLWKQTACLCSVSSLVSSQIHFFFPSLCLFDLQAFQPWAELDFSKTQPRFCHLWLVLWPLSMAQEVEDKTVAGSRGRIALLPDLLFTWQLGEENRARGLAKDRTDRALDCIKRWFNAHRKENMSDTRMCAQMNTHAGANKRTVATGVSQLLPQQNKRLSCVSASMTQWKHPCW